jgi:membrane protease YdiL (CAAX protease family)
MANNEEDSLLRQPSWDPSQPALPEVVPADALDLPSPIHGLDQQRVGEDSVLLSENDEEVPEVLPAPRPPHPNFGWALLWCLGFLLVTQILCPVVGFFIILFWEVIRAPTVESVRQTLTPEWLQEIVQRSAAELATIVGISVISFSLVAVRLVVGRNWKRRLALKPPSLAHFILVLLGFPALFYLAEGIYALARRYLPGMHDFGLPGMEDAVEQFSTWNPAVAVLIIGVGAGIGEELWCRGFLGRGLVGNYGIIPGVLLTSLFFGLIHIDPQQATMAFFMGICLHFVYLTSRSLLLAMFLHFFNNSVSVLLLTLPITLPGTDNDSSNENIHPVLYLGSVFLLAAVGWAMYVSRVRLIRRSDELPSWRPDYPGVEYPPAGSGTVVWRPWPGWQASGVVLGGVLIFALSIYVATVLGAPR